MNDDPPNISQLSKVDKPPRPPHVIALADIIADTQHVRDLPALLVAWYEDDLEAGTRSFRFSVLGQDDNLIALAERTKLMIVANLVERTDSPKDAP